MANTRLTKGAILYLSVGFTQHCHLQLLSLQRAPGHALAMIVYDGQVYAGALYRLPSTQSQPQEHTLSTHSRVQAGVEQAGTEGGWMRELDVIEAKGVPTGPNEPIELREVRVVATGLTNILGQQILSLREYMNRRRFCALPTEEQTLMVEFQGRKKVKTNPEDSKEERGEMIERKENEGASVAQLEDDPEKENQELEIERRDESQKGNGEEEEKAEGEKTGPEQVQRKREREKHPLPSTDHSRSHPSSPKNGAESELPHPENELPHPENELPHPVNELPQPEAEREGVSRQHQVQPIQIQQFLPVQQEQPSVPKNNQPQCLASCQNEGNPRLPVRLQKPAVIELLQEEDDEITEPKAVIKSSRIIDLEDEIRSEPTRPSSKSCRQTNSARIRNGEQHILVSDLYERMHRFRLLCRINHISTFTTQKGKSTTRLMIVDEEGDQVMCQLFRKASESHSKELELLRGRAYYFENGEVEQDDTGCLSISVPFSGIRLTSSQISPFSPHKMQRVNQIQNIETSQLSGRAVTGSCNSINSKKAHSKQVNVVGILKGLRDEPKLVNNQFRTQGVLLDPHHHKSITFCLFLDELVSFPQAGAVLSLHNMRLTEYQHTFRLEASKRSYYLVHSNTPLPYLKDLQESSLKGSWKLNDYCNISEVRYVPRTIAQIKELLSSITEHDQCHSEVDCNVANVSEKREYLACLSCQHETKPAKGTHTYCFHCKKIQRVSQRFLFRAEIADGTGSLEISLSNPEADVFLGVGAEQYGQMDRQERGTILELSAFQNVVLRVRSEKIIGGSTHFATRAEKVSHRRTYEQIKAKEVDSRTKMISHW